MVAISSVAYSVDNSEEVIAAPSNGDQLTSIDDVQRALNRSRASVYR